jgi:hypothetical protein
LLAGTIDAALHAGYHQGGGAAAETDAQASADLTAPLSGLWAGASSAQVAHGTIFAATLATWNAKPPKATGARTRRHGPRRPVQRCDVRV